MFNVSDGYCWCRLPCGLCSRTGQPCPKVSNPEPYPVISYGGTGMPADLSNQSGKCDPAVTATNGTYTKASGDFNGGKTEDKS